MKKLIVFLMVCAISVTSFASTSDAKVKKFSQESKLVDACYSKENIAVSPMSLNQALGMVQNGASGKTAKELNNYLGMSASEYNKYSKKFNSNLAKELKVANSVWLTDNKSYVLSDKFSKTLKDNYKVSCQRVAFGTDAGTKKINTWVKKKTGGMIPKMFDSTSSSTRLTLINAIYFESEWLSNFEKNDTYKGTFNGLTDKSNNVDFMYGETNYYLENSKALGVVKPYKNQRFEFIAILPKKSGDFKLSNLDIESLMKGKKMKSVHYNLPKFEVESTLSLKDVLSKDFGVKLAFTDDAEFSKLLSSGQPLKIDKVSQKVKIKVDENGTKAAAATSVEMTDCAIALQDKFKQIDFNRPFAFVIYDKETDSVLFYGKIVDL